ncbi:hypothetical protein Tco_1088620 [Tanacetum coccineum]
MQDKPKLSKSQGASTPDEVKRMQRVPYASVVGSIMYVVRCTRPEVAFAQNITSQFQQNPRELLLGLLLGKILKFDKCVDSRSFDYICIRFKMEVIVGVEEYNAKASCKSST